MKKKIKDILENNYYNAGLDMQTATDELLNLFSVSGLLPLENTIEELEQMSNNYEVVDGCYVIKKHIFDAYIENLKALKQ